MNVMEITLTAEELARAEDLLLRRVNPKPFSFKAKRFHADFGPATEVVEVMGPVHTKYPRDGGAWVKQFEKDLSAGNFS